MNYLNRLKKAMSDITEFAPIDNPFGIGYQNISIHNYDPPSYIVGHIFFTYLNYTNHGTLDKIWWHTFFKYKDSSYFIHDYKFGSWSIEAIGDIEKAKLNLPNIIGKIKECSHYADKLLQEEFKIDIQNDKFWIKNNYHSLMNMYLYYKKELKNKIKRHEDKSHVLYKTIPLIISFFSFLEFFLDVVYAFSDSEMNFIDFRKMPWQDRFKEVINVNDNQKVTPIYTKLVSIKSEYRNPLMHGLTNESSLIVSSPYEGLVPISFTHLEGKLELGLYSFKINNSIEILECFDMFIRFIKRNKPYSFYVMYLDTRFEIPINNEQIQRIKKHMTSKKVFNDYINDRLKYSDMIRNREI